MIYKLTRQAGGAWSFSHVHSFTPLRGSIPASRPIFSRGALFGTTLGGGPFTGPCGTTGCGTVYRFKP